MLGEQTQVMDDRVVIDSITDQIKLMKTDIFTALDDKKSVQAQQHVAKLKENIAKETYRSSVIACANSVYYLDEMQSLSVDQRMKEYLRLRVFASLGFTLNTAYYNDFINDSLSVNSMYIPNNTIYGFAFIADTIGKKSDILNYLYEDKIPTFLSVMAKVARNYSIVFNYYRPYGNSWNYVDNSYPYNPRNKGENAKDFFLMGDTAKDLSENLMNYNYDLALKKLREFAKFITYEEIDNLKYVNYIANNTYYPFMNTDNMGIYPIKQLEPFKSYLAVAKATNRPDYLEARLSQYAEVQPLIVSAFNEFFDKIIPPMLKWEFAKAELDKVQTAIDAQDTVISKIKTRIKGTLSSLRESFPEHQFPTLEDILKEYENRTQVLTKDSSETKSGGDELSEETKELAGETKKGGAALLIGAAAIAALTMLG